MTTTPEAIQIALSHQLAGRFADAVQVCRQILQADPRQADALGVLGDVAQQTGQAELHVELGKLAAARGDWSAAADWHQKALAIDPQLAAAEAELGVARHAQKRLDDAIVHYRRALRLDPSDLESQVNLAAALESREGQAEALELYRAVLAANPAHARALWRIDKLLWQRGEFSEAVEHYDRALEHAPQAAWLRFNRGLLLLANGDFGPGWEGYEWRTQVFGSPSDVLSQPVWDGSELHGASLLVHGEQGLGDALQFVRYMRLIEQRGIQPVLTVRDLLVPLFKQAGFANVFGFSETLPACEFKISLASLPRLFGTTLSTIPAEVPYLSAGPELVATWRERLRPLDGIRVGICWQGSATHRADHLRSIALEQFEPLARIAGVKLISLQKQGAEDLERLARRFEVHELGHDWDQVSPFLDSAAVMKNLDLVITVDTVTAHLAGALGVPVWVALAQRADWRWLHDRDDNPWYPTMRLFRQNKLQEWSDVFERMALGLETLVSQAATRRPTR